MSTAAERIAALIESPATSVQEFVNIITGKDEYEQHRVLDDLREILSEIHLAESPEVQRERRAYERGYEQALVDAENALKARALKTHWASDARLFKVAIAEVVKLAHPEAAADVAGLAWAIGGQNGPVPPGAFPLWASPDCRHDVGRQRRDGRGTICLDCGVLRILA